MTATTSAAHSHVPVQSPVPGVAGLAGLAGLAGPEGLVGASGDTGVVVGVSVGDPGGTQSPSRVPFSLQASQLSSIVTSIS